MQCRFRTVYGINVKNLYLAAILTAITTANIACSNPHHNFCMQAAETYCAKCKKCDSYEQYCSMKNTADKMTCKKHITAVCEAYDANYSGELAKTCLDQIENISCRDLAANGKPDICNRLF